MHNGKLHLAVPPGHVDAHCLTCKTDVVIPEGTLRCPQGDHAVEPTSLPRMLAVENVPELVREVPMVKSEAVVLPAIRQAETFDRATDELIAALEAEEARALADFERARERVLVARRSLKALRAVRGLVTVDGAATAEGGGKIVRRPRALKNGRWSRKHERCIVCGTTQVEHKAFGRCSACAAYFQIHKTERPPERWARESAS